MPRDDAPKKGRAARARSKPDVEKKDDEFDSSTVTSQAHPTENWADQPDSPAYEAAAKLWQQIVKAYQNKDEQIQAIGEYWSIYNANPDDNQMYSGNSQGYIPAVRDALNARSKRALKQLFPVNMKHVDGLASDGKTPYVQLSLLEHYIRKLRLQSVVRTDLISGDVTGQWGLMLDWTRTHRSIKKLVRKNPLIEEIDGEDISDLGLEDPTQDEYEDTEDDEVIEEGPEIIDFATEDLAVIPPTCSSIAKAKAVCLKIRMSPEHVQEMVDEGVFILPENVKVEELCTPSPGMDKKNREKKQSHEVGVRTEGTYKHALVFMTYTRLDLGGDTKESAIVYFKDQETILGIIRNPLWSGKVPILSEPVERLSGSFFGKSKVEPVKFLQWQCTDFWNMGQDSAMYSLLPIWAVNPLTVPQWQTLTMGLGALWPAAPDDIKPMMQPQLWKDSAQICDLIKKQIWESLEVNEMMMGRMPPGRKNNQMVGGMQQEQQVSITDHASRYEQVMLNPLCEMLFEFDQQFRTEDVTIESRGEIGVEAALEVIPPQQWGERYFFRWSGTEYLMGVQRMQQQIATMNVLKGIPPQQLNGRTFDATPIMEIIVENVFGPEAAPKILIDKRNHYMVPPDVENEMLWNGFHNVDVHEADDDPKHIQSHMAAAANADPMGLFHAHIMAHMVQMQGKRQMQQMPKPGGLPGGPGGGPGAAPPQGAAGAPRPGAMPAPGRPAQQPPGAIQADQMADPAAGQRG